MTPLTVCIDARLAGGSSGGVEQVVIGLAAGLARLGGGDERYLFLAHEGEDEWLRPYARGPVGILQTRMEYPGQPGFRPGLRRALVSRVPAARRRLAVLRSDGTAERAGAEVIHFPMQEGFITDLPSIYHPHDLQHLHLPDLFPRSEVARREVVYRTLCAQASLVAMMTSWGKWDLVERYGLPADKVAVTPWGSVVSEYPEPSADEVERARADLELPEEFLLFPAQTWPHKNHLRLLEALALARDRHGVVVPVVCPGRRNAFFDRIAARADELGLRETVLFPGYVGRTEIRALYALARGLVFPSLFEGWGMPVSEAFASGIPVASSDATGLPDVVGDAGLLFDPEDADRMAEAIVRLWSDEELRRRLVERGRRRAELFSIDRAAALFRAHYRRLAGRQTDDEDRILMRTPPPA